MPENEEKDINKIKTSWKIDKQIPLALIFSILLQCGVGIWWGATLTNNLENVATQVKEIRIDIYTIRDADKDKALINHKVDDVTRRVQNLEIKIER